MGIKETPINFRIFYKRFKEYYEEKLEATREVYDDLVEEERANYEDVKSNIDVYKNEFKIDLMKYPEFVNNKYSEGKFHKVAKGLFINRNNNYELVTDLFNLYTVARQQKQLADLDKEKALYLKLTSLTLKQYTEYLRHYMTIVHKKLILEGGGYSLGQHIGWICINRCILVNPHPKLDFAATKKRKAELLAEGKRLFNKDEADFCKRNGLDYDGVDYRVYMKKEAVYEIPLLGCKLPNAGILQLEIADYRNTSTRGKTNQELIDNCKGNTEAICELPLDLKTKLTLCDQVDKILYTKFIRNENQEPSAARKANR